MSSSRLRTLDLSSTEREAFNTALLTLELIFKGDVRGLIIHDAVGTCIAPDPGHELELFQWFTRVNWPAALRAVEEHR